MSTRKKFRIPEKPLIVLIRKVTTTRLGSLSTGFQEFRDVDRRRFA